MERLDKMLAHEGFGTRKDVKKLIRTGVVTVNGTVCKATDLHINEETDTICVNKDELQLHSEMYLMLNKPQDTVSTSKDGLHQTVFDLLDDRYHNLLLSGKLHLVGRLDIDTEGLLIITTDGKFTHRLISPKTHISKTYYVKLRDMVSGIEKSETKVLLVGGQAADYIKKISTGLQVASEGSEASFIAEPADLEWIDENSCYLTIYEGKYHQVKRMFSALGNKVTFLKRVSMGNLKLDPLLKAGEFRELTESELQLLK
jgi:16S rRNA pseudouridine516 synthase